MDLAIRNNQTPPPELVEHIYRKLFSLSYIQMMDEPIHVVHQSIAIEQLLKEYEQDVINAS